MFGWCHSMVIEVLRSITAHQILVTCVLQKTITFNAGFIQTQNLIWNGDQNFVKKTNAVNSLINVDLHLS
jgi:hypothetical protein